MTITRVTAFSFAILLLAACSPKKKAATSPALADAPPPPPSAGPAVILPATRPEVGYYPPRNEELLAIQATHNDVTMLSLQQGYAIYTGACIKCHPAANISTRSENAWYSIIDNMAPKAALTPAEKSAVLNYVLSVKAAQSQGK